MENEAKSFVAGTVQARETKVVIRYNDTKRVAGIEWPSEVYIESPPLHGPLKTLLFIAKASDQGWGNTGDSKLFLDVYDPLTGEIAHRSSFVLTHNLRTIRRVFNFEDDLVRRSGTGHALRLVMVSAPWPGWSCCVTECSFSYDCDRDPNSLELRRAFIKALTEDQNGPWRRSKLMVIGQGRAGKSATVRSLLGQTFEPNLPSTVGAHVSQSVVHSSSTSDGIWKPVDAGESQDFTGEFAEKIAKSALNMSRLSRRLSTRKGSKGKSGRLSIMTNPRISGTVRRSIRKMSVRKVLGERGDEREEPVDMEKLQEQERSLQEELRGLSQDDLPRMRRLEHSFEMRHDLSENSISFTIWDYGGQTVFQTLHHLFLTKYGIYMLVVDMREVLNHEQEALEYIHFWLVSVAMYAPDAPLLIVGTHLDSISSRQELDQIDAALNKEVGKYCSRSLVHNTNKNRSYFPLNNKNAEGIDDIRCAIEESAERQEYVNNEVPLRWMKLMDKVLSLKQPYISLKRFTQLRDEIWEDAASKVEDFEVMLNMFHELGVIVHLTSTEALNNTITLDPQWLIDNVTKPIRDVKLHPFSAQERQELQETGLIVDVNRLFHEAIVSIDLLEFFWSKEQTQFFLDFMKHTMLLSSWPWTGEEMFLIPSMITATEHSGIISSFESMHGALDFPNGLPTGVFERMVCMLISQASGGRGKEPLLSHKAASIWLSPTDVVELNQSKDTIVFFCLPKVAPIALQVVQSVFTKLKSDLFGPEFQVRIKVEGQGKFWRLEEAKEREDCKRWFSTKPLRESVRIRDFQV